MARNTAKLKPRKETRNKVKINIRIPESTFDWIIENNYTVTEAVNEALERLFYRKTEFFDLQPEEIQFLKRRFYRNASFVNLRLEDLQLLNELNELKNDYIKIASAKNQQIQNDCKFVHTA